MLFAFLSIMLSTNFCDALSEWVSSSLPSVVPSKVIFARLFCADIFTFFVCRFNFFRSSNRLGSFASMSSSASSYLNLASSSSVSWWSDSSSSDTVASSFSPKSIDSPYLRDSSWALASSFALCFLRFSRRRYLRSFLNCFLIYFQRTRFWRSSCYTSFFDWWNRSSSYCISRRTWLASWKTRSIYYSILSLALMAAYNSPVSIELVLSND